MYLNSPRLHPTPHPLADPAAFTKRLSYSFLNRKVPGQILKLKLKINIKLKLNLKLKLKLSLKLNLKLKI